MSNRGKKNKKGVSLVETTLALALVAIVFSMAVSAILLMSSLSVKIENSRQFMYIVSNYLECYKIGGREDFDQNVKLYLDISIDTKTSGSCVVKYSGRYSVAKKVEDERFILTISTENGFFARVFHTSGDQVFIMEEPYVSRFDM